MKSLESIAKWIIYLGAGCLIVTSVLFICKFVKKTPVVDSQIMDHYGSFIGGLVGSLFTLASALLIIQTLRDQQKQQIEGRFFELLRLHREHVENLSFKGEDDLEIKSSAVFSNIFAEFCKLYITVNKIISSGSADVYNLCPLDYIGAVYASLFFRNEISNMDELKRILKEKNVPEVIIDGITKNPKPIFKPIYMANAQKISAYEYEHYSDANTIIAGGYIDILANYYRHLFHAIKYIDENNSLSYTEKYGYIKILRAQMSNNEQRVFFLNSMSFLGDSWEMKNRNKIINKSTSHQCAFENKCLVTKYNLIKNIPFAKLYIQNEDKTSGPITIDLRYKSLYPDVKFEGDEDITKNRKRLIKYAYS